MTVADQVNEALDDAFTCFDTLDSWQLFNSKYQQLSFNDPIDDATRIAEYKYIGEQLRKYINRRESVLRKDSDPYRIRDQLFDYLKTAKTELTDRKSVVYCSIRNDWLRQLSAQMMMIIEEMERQDEVDEW